MDLFFNLGFAGLALIILGKVELKEKLEKKNKHNFKIEIIDKFISYTESYEFAKINLRYGTLLLITGIIGFIFYNTLGLMMVGAMVLSLGFYLTNTFITGYKYFKDAK